MIPLNLRPIFGSPSKSVLLKSDPLSAGIHLPASRPAAPALPPGANRRRWSLQYTSDSRWRSAHVLRRCGAVPDTPAPPILPYLTIINRSIEESELQRLPAIFHINFFFAVVSFIYFCSLFSFSSIAIFCTNSFTLLSNLEMSIVSWKHLTSNINIIKRNMKLVVEYTPTNSDIQSAICGKILNKTRHPEPLVQEQNLLIM